MYPSVEQVMEWRQRYKKGMRVKLIFMDDVQAPPKGTKGTVQYVDSIGTLHINWDNGSTLGIVIGEDLFEVVSTKE